MHVLRCNTHVLRCNTHVPRCNAHIWRCSTHVLGCNTHVLLEVQYTKCILWCCFLFVILTMMKWHFTTEYNATVLLYKPILTQPLSVMSRLETFKSLQGQKEITTFRNFVHYVPANWLQCTDLYMTRCTLITNCTNLCMINSLCRYFSPLHSWSMMHFTWNHQVYTASIAPPVPLSPSFYHSAFSLSRFILFRIVTWASEKGCCMLSSRLAKSCSQYFMTRKMLQPWQQVYYNCINNLICHRICQHDWCRL